MRAEAIRAVVAEFANVEFLNLRPFMPLVESEAGASSFVETSGSGTVWETAALRTPEDVDRVAGIHL